MADARVVVIDARLWVRNPISIVISSAIASAALAARRKMGPPHPVARMTARVGFSNQSKGVSLVHLGTKVARHQGSGWRAEGQAIEGTRPEARKVPRAAVGPQ
jgi:hypothetical protein